MKKSIFIIVLPLLGLICSSSDSFQVTKEENGTKIVTGKFDRDVLAKDQDFKGWYDFNYKSYTIDTSQISMIDSLSKNVKYIIFLGTWCSDSKREVPHLMKILDIARVNPKNIELYGLDRLKKSPKRFEEKYTITLVPTVIVNRDSVEIGRIVEAPKETLEKELVKILSVH